MPNRQISVHGVRTLIKGGRSVDWHPGNKRLLIGRRGADRYFNVYSLSADGRRINPMTLRREPGNSNLHNGAPSWAPDGLTFLFVGQNSESTSYRMSLPGTGLNCNIWLGDVESGKFHKLTDQITRYTHATGVGSPVFSPDGTKLFWSGNTGNYPRASVWGERALYTADLSTRGGKPKLKNIHMFQPGRQKDFYESHGYSPDGHKLIFSGNLEARQSVAGMDIYTYDLRTSKLVNLTKSGNAWDQYATYSPDGNKIIYMSSRNQRIPYLPISGNKWQRHLISELWIMNANGKYPRQVTHFNTPGHLESVDTRCYVEDSAWGPDGKTVALALNYETRNFDIESRIVILELGIGPPPDTPVEATTDTQDPAARYRKGERMGGDRAKRFQGGTGTFRW